MRLVLASSSPRRRDLLAAAGFAFEVIPSLAEEIHDVKIPLTQLCEMNAILKAEAVAEMHPDCAVVGADTLVFIDEIPLGKPKDWADANEMLRRLSGRTHTVCTAVCGIFPESEREVFHELTDVTFHELNDEAVAEYLSLVDPLDKAGSYGIQAHGEKVVAYINGNHDNVMGLPVAKLTEMLKRHMAPVTCLV